MADVVAKGQNVKVKVLSITGKKISLSMKVRYVVFKLIVKAVSEIRIFIS